MILISLLQLFAHRVHILVIMFMNCLLQVDGVLFSRGTNLSRRRLFFLFINYHYVFIIAQLCQINKCPKSIQCVHFCAATGNQNCCKKKLLAEEQLALLAWE